MARKRRFGVSLPSGMAEELDALAARLRIDRSKLVERAVASFLNEYRHYLHDHECSGVMIISGSFDRGEVASLLDEYRDIVVSTTHIHVNELCTEIVVVNGPSEKIAEMHTRLSSVKGCSIRYIPFSTVHGVVGASMKHG
ncbi:MAG TPA: CopG family ribbon-helix-helix protein [Pyrodictium delaneyi]|uniref:CopG family ribbon-helix-helix protein n=1 Tax=Pyrodictium delaneyi TaxID=1273541 RepID=A0A832ZT35_9CREN|nr:CopG family ribbon-helix-helix protein [Pyrodictium delaneyi]